MLTEAAALKQIARELNTKGREFKELPQLRQLIEAEKRYQGVELEARQREIGFNPQSNGYTCDDHGQVIGLCLYKVHLTDYKVLQDFPHLSCVSLLVYELKEITFLAGLTQLTQLNLEGNRISDLSPLSRLMQLTKLYLNDNQISNLTPLSGLIHLRHLSLSKNQIRDLTPLLKLTKLTQLNLNEIFSRNQIRDLTPLSGLTQLSQIDLGNNQIRDLTPLYKLTQLTRLNLSYNKINDLTPLSELTQLMELNLNINQIRDLTPLTELTQLIDLNLNSNQILDLTPLRGLTQLSRLNLGYNEINDLTPLSELTQLIELNLSNNQIHNLTPLSKLSKLSRLDLSNNQIHDITPLSGLIQLTLLCLELNQVRNLIPLSKLAMLQSLNVDENPLEFPPVEIVKRGQERILAWLKSIGGGENLPLNEVKVLLVGDGGAGKTSLIKQLLERRFDCNESQTHGIKIRHAKMRMNGENEIKVHFWDFGGQEIMHATHQFFLSKRSLYILVLDSRKDDKTEYWLKHIASFGGDSTVLVVLNKIDEHPGFEVNRRFLQEKYPAIQGFYRISCATREGFQEFSENLMKALYTVELVSTPWAKTWFTVKTHLEKSKEDFLSYEDYQTMCREAYVTEQTAQETLVRTLHQLGIVLHFKDLELLDTQVLNPKWVTDAVYRIINSEQLASGKGVLRLEHLNAIL